MKPSSQKNNPPQEASDLVVEATVAFVRDLFRAEATGHDWWHIFRVWKTACLIGEAEGADLFTVQLGALLHDVADWKFHGGDDGAGPRKAREWLESRKVPETAIAHVCTIIREVTFKGAGVPTPASSLEGMVVQDADRLDALGAMGIARAFAYGGYKGHPMHDPEMPPRLHASFEDYKKSRGTTINHFYEKLLLLKDRMHTETARRLAEERHAFMEAYLRQFFREWEADGQPE